MTVAAAPNQIVVGDYLSGSGATVHVIQTGTTNLVFVDSLGNLVLGSYINSTQATASAWRGDIATFSGNQVNWSDGTVWTQTGKPASKITVTDYINPNGVPVHIVQNGTTPRLRLDGNGNTSLGTAAPPPHWPVPNFTPVTSRLFSIGTVMWSDGTVWTQTTPFRRFSVPPMPAGLVAPAN